MSKVDHRDALIKALRADNERLWTWLAEKLDAPAETAKTISKSICEIHGVTWAEVVGDSRKQEYFEVRCEIAFSLHCEGWSSSRIARLLHRDPTSVRHMLERRKYLRPQFKAAAE